MSVARTPPCQVQPEPSAEVRIKLQYKVWRRALHQAKDYRVKILRTLADDGNGEAAELLCDPPREPKAARCNRCAGCGLMTEEGACKSCLGCERGKGCEEHHRRCRDWRTNAHAHHAGSVITAISSQFDLVTMDLSKYEAVVGELREADLEMEEIMDDIPGLSLIRGNPRFDPAARTRDLDDERHHLAKLATLLQRHSEVASRLQELHSEEDDAFDEGGEDFSRTEQGVEDAEAPSKVLTQTQTSRDLIQLFQDPLVQPGDLSAVIEVSEGGDEDAPLQDNQWSFGGLETMHYDSPPRIDPPRMEEVASRNPPLPVQGPRPTLESRTAADEARCQAETLRLAGPGLQLLPRITRPVVSEPRGPVMQWGGRQPPAMGRSTQTAPFSSASGPRMNSELRLRRRSRSNEFVAGERTRSAPLVDSVEAQDRLFELTTWVRTRQSWIRSRLAAMSTAMASATSEVRVNPAWLQGEERAILITLGETEKVEAEAWRLTARLLGSAQRTERAREWAEWHRTTVGTLASLQGNAALVLPPPQEPRRAQDAGCQRRGGFLERVRLPVFSGSIEDYGEYKTQFQELCKGEAYSEVVELAQMRQKLPKEAVTLICGITTPAAAWARLDETYGNTDMQVLAALKRLRAVKPSKSAVHDQVVEVVNAVQRCVTVLRALDREEDFLLDRETLAEVVNVLPVDSQQRWYHRQGPREVGQREKGGRLLAWLEEERRDAVAMHLDALARRPKPPAPTAQPPRQPAAPGGTDQSIYNVSNAVVGAQPDGVTNLAQGGGDRREEQTSKPKGRVDVTSEAQAREVAAKRKTNLEAKQIDKCPLCKKQHDYEKTWPLSPPVKTKLVSTLLTSCPQFLSLPPSQKLVSLTAHAACLHCTSWEHAKHRFGGRELPDPKCKVMEAGAECGGKHGKWFHASSGTTGSLVSATESPGESGSSPGLFEVYRAEFVNSEGGFTSGTIMIDSGSDTDYVRHGFAADLGLEGDPHRCRIKVVDMEYRTVKTAKYGMTVVDKDGERHSLTAQGLSSITTLPPDPDLTPLLPLLDGVPAEVVDRPQGRIDVLLGLRSSSLHGRDERESGEVSASFEPSLGVAGRSGGRTPCCGRPAWTIARPIPRSFTP